MCRRRLLFAGLCVGGLLLLLAFSFAVPMFASPASDDYMSFAISSFCGGVDYFLSYNGVFTGNVIDAFGFDYLCGEYFRSVEASDTASFYIESYLGDGAYTLSIQAMNYDPYHTSSAVYVQVVELGSTSCFVHSDGWQTCSYSFVLTEPQTVTLKAGLIGGTRTLFDNFFLYYQSSTPTPTPDFTGTPSPTPSPTPGGLPWIYVFVNPPSGNCREYVDVNTGLLTSAGSLNVVDQLYQYEWFTATVSDSGTPNEDSSVSDRYVFCHSFDPVDTNQYYEYSSEHVGHGGYLIDFDSILTAQGLGTVFDWDFHGGGGGQCYSFDETYSSSGLTPVSYWHLGVIGYWLDISSYTTENFCSEPTYADYSFAIRFYGDYIPPTPTPTLTPTPYPFPTVGSPTPVEGTSTATPAPTMTPYPTMTPRPDYPTVTATPTGVYEGAPDMGTPALPTIAPPGIPHPTPGGGDIFPTLMPGTISYTEVLGGGDFIPGGAEDWLYFSGLGNEPPAELVTDGCYWVGAPRWLPDWLLPDFGFHICVYEYRYYWGILGFHFNSDFIAVVLMLALIIGLFLI